ncbi:MAG: hypothetical protein RL385_181 [Pseudomonadota bacterium]|jgi:hypothetical protein
MRTAINAFTDQRVDDAYALLVGELGTVGGDSVEVAEVPVTCFVHERERVRGEDLMIGACALQAVRDVFSGVGGVSEVDARVRTSARSWARRRRGQ